MREWHLDYSNSVKMNRREVCRIGHARITEPSSGPTRNDADDARLIAAAPKLLRSLAVLVASQDHPEDLSDGDYERAREAIREAVGGRIADIVSLLAGYY